MANCSIERTKLGFGSGIGGIAAQMASQSSSLGKHSRTEVSRISITQECTAHSLGASLKQL